MDGGIQEAFPPVLTSISDLATSVLKPFTCALPARRLLSLGGFQDIPFNQE